MVKNYGWRQPVIRMAQLGVEPLDLEIRCKSTAFQTKRSLKNKERAKNLLFVDNLMHFAKSDIGTFNRNSNMIVGMCN